jgi:hypothetical protein
LGFTKRVENQTFSERPGIFFSLASIVRENIFEKLDSVTEDKSCALKEVVVPSSILNHGKKNDLEEMAKRSKKNSIIFVQDKGQSLCHSVQFLGAVKL